MDDTSVSISSLGQDIWRSDITQDRATVISCGLVTAEVCLLPFKDIGLQSVKMKTGVEFGIAIIFFGVGLKTVSLKVALIFPSPTLKCMGIVGEL